jgi:hypothetical protein
MDCKKPLSAVPFTSLRKEQQDPELDFREILDALCGLVGHSERADSVCILKATGKFGGIILGSWGCNARSLSGDVHLSELDALKRPFLIAHNLDRAKWFRSHPLWIVSPFAKSMIAISLPDMNSRVQYYIALFFNLTSTRSREPNTNYLSSVARMASMILGQLPQPPANGSNSFADGTAPPGVSYPPVGEDAVLAFLANTLTPKIALRNKGDVSFIIVRQWKAALKEVQLSAFEGLKIRPSKVAANMIAQEISTVVAKFYEGTAFNAIVPVPCGSSGTSNCMSVEIARFVSEITGVPMKNCLVGEYGKGRSHPHKSKQLKPYSVQGDISGSVLLVDDVVTSGKHIQMAVDALRNKGVSVSAVAWLGG